MSTPTLRVTLLKPSKYEPDGYVARYRRGFMPNSTIRHIDALTPNVIGGCRTVVTMVDEYVQVDLAYLDRLHPDHCDLLALVGVQSHQWHRALDLAALAKERGVPHVIIGGPHAMTCETPELDGTGISLSIAEGEITWPMALADAIAGELAPIYGNGRRWAQELNPVVLTPPTREELRHYLIPMLGIYPARGCPFTCNFCSVIEIAGRKVRREPLEATIATLVAAKRAGVKFVMITSDNFNKMPGVRDLLHSIIDERLGLAFFVQCDVQIAKDPELVELMARAGVFSVFVGAESFDRKVLLAASKNQNRPEQYVEIVRLCHAHGITPHFSNIIGFPSQTEADIRDHMVALKEVNPDVASFYILCPIPGTVQYAEFLGDGWITESNLDRFDGSSVTWRHPNITVPRLRQLLSWCYQEHYSLRRVLGRLRSPHWRRSPAPLELSRYILGAAFVRWSAWRGTHPMSGGIGRIRLDHVRQYLELRRRRFCFTLAPLPRNRSLAPAERSARLVATPS